MLPTLSFAQAPANHSVNWETVVAAAKKEGRVVFYAIDIKAHTQVVAEAFQKKYPEIKIVWHNGNTVEMSTRLAAEEKAQSETADVFSTIEPTVMSRWSAEGKLRPIIGPNYAELTKSVFAKYPDLAPGDDRAMYSGVAYNIAWNTDRIKNPITGYADLVARVNELSNGRLGAIAWLGQASGLFYSNIEERVSGIDLTKDMDKSAWLTKLGALKPKFYNSGSPVAQAVASGEVSAGIYAPVPSLVSLKGMGAPIEFVFDKSVPTSVGYMLVNLKRGSNPNAAQVLIDFLLSEEGQEAAASGQALTVRPDVKGAYGGPEYFSVPRDAVANEVFLTKYRALWDKVMGQ